MILDVPDFADESLAGGPDPLQAALDAANDGDRIYLPGVTPYRAPATGWEVRKSVEIFGDGPGNPDLPPSGRTGTLLIPHSSSTNDHVIRLVAKRKDSYGVDQPIDLQQIHIHDLRITSSSATSRAGGDGIKFSADGSGQRLTGMRVERVSISSLAGNAVSLHGINAGSAYVNTLLIEDCSFDGCGARGVDLRHAYASVVSGCASSGNGTEALGSDAGGELALFGCRFQGGGLAGGPPVVNLDSLAQARVSGCRFVGFGSTNSRIGLRLLNVNGPASVAGCSFELDQMEAAAIGLDLSFDKNLASGVACIMPNRFVNVGTAIRGNVADFQNVHALFIAPQFGTPGQYGTPSQDACVIALPTIDDRGTGGTPSVCSDTFNRTAALLIPVLSTDPTDVIPPAHLIYNSTADKLRLGTMDGWLDVILT